MKIIYEDKYILAVEKSAGEASQGTENAIDRQAEKYLRKSCHIISRLDMPVGGIVLLAKDKRTAAELTKMLQGEINKYYYAVVNGEPSEGTVLKDYLMKDSRLNISRIVNRGNIGAKYAELEYKTIAQIDSTSLLKIKLLTGRHHQIRAQLAHAGIPICGDTKYNPAYRHKSGVFPALYCTEISFIHPVTKENLTISSVPGGGYFEIYKELF